MSSTRATGRLRRAAALGAPAGPVVDALGQACFDAAAVRLAPATGAVDLQATFARLVTPSPVLGRFAGYV